MKIYKVGADYSGYTLAPKVTDLWARGGVFNGERMRPGWTRPTFYVLDPVKTRELDFFNVHSGGLAFSERVYEGPLGEILERAGEVLPAMREDTGQEFYILNPLACFNCLDRQKSKLRTTPDGAVVIQVSEHGFFPERVGDSTLFKIPETRLTELYAITGRNAPSDEFFHTYHEEGLNGLTFKEIWKQHS